ncbi:hypothetical protein [Aquimarina pacifica]|uniref:hypothetical protein n=1 Tax=Aquimarina pacifica TaxID=1296415 RepID=UPI0004717807|nr:hypothetical protein [Aquimarina pacifica]
MKDLRSIGNILSKTQQKNIKGGLSAPKNLELVEDCQFPPLAPPPEGCDWQLDRIACTATLVCGSLSLIKR